MNGTLLQFGPFSFAVDTAAYDELSRTTSWTWAEVDRFGGQPALQYVGKALETFDLRGRLIPGFTGGPEQLARMREIGNLAIPMPLISGTGIVHGAFVIESLGERVDIVFVDGSPRRMEFDIKLKQYSTNLYGIPGANQLSAASRILSLF